MPEIKPYGFTSRFAIRALVCIPLCMLAWWFLLLDPLLAMLRGLLDHLLTWFLGAHVAGVADFGRGWFIMTSVSLMSDPERLVGFQINPVKYSVALPLFWGLVLATPNARRVAQLGLGSLLLLWLAATFMLLVVLFRLALQANQVPLMTERPSYDYVFALPYPAWQYQLIGLGRQLGHLVGPVFAPLVLWLALNRHAVMTLVGEGLRRPQGGTGQGSA